MTDIATPADGGQGAAAPAAAPVSAPAAPAAAPAPALSWLPGADEATVGYVQNKGWSEPGQVLEGYRNLEKLLGADRAGSTLIVPKADAPAEEWGKVYDRLGRPADPAGYNIDVPENIGSKDFARAAAAKFHELGLSQKQGEQLAAWWNSQATEAMTAQQQAAQERFTADDMALKRDWGAAYTQNLNQAQAAFRGLGVTAEQVDALSQAWGHKATMEFFQKIGSRMGEDSFVTGDKTEKFGQAMTPGQAKAEIDKLRQDKGFTAKLLNRDAEATDRWTRLHQFAYPEAT